MLSGDNSILSKATSSKENTEKQAIIETAKMDILSKQTENHGSLSEDELKEILTSPNYNTQGTLSNEESILDRTLTSKDKKYEIPVSKIYNGYLDSKNDMLKGPNGKTLINQITVAEITNNKIVGEDKFGNQVVVPKGFKVANDSGAIVKDGIVIEDNEGNQYVWIPVSNINHDGSNKIKVNSETEEGVEITLGRYTFDTSSPGNPILEENKYQFANTYNNQVYLGYNMTELPNYRICNGYNEPSDNTTARGCLVNGSYNGIQGFIESVDTNKGYYVARYEASYRTNGKAGSIPSTSSADVLALTEYHSSWSVGDLWNFINQPDATEACYDLYTTVSSDLMNSYAWDTALMYIQLMGNENYANIELNGNEILKNTGSTEDQKCKIFDMAGNTQEWTTEYSSAWHGGDDGAWYPAVARGGYSRNENTIYGKVMCEKYSWIGSQLRIKSFRPVLFL